MDDLADVIRGYFSNGHRYSVILHLLKEYHGIAISLRTLKRKLRDLGLCRRRQPSAMIDIWNAVLEELRGPGNYPPVNVVMNIKLGVATARQRLATRNFSRMCNLY